MKPFVVELRVRTVVMGEDESDAYSNALNDWREIAGDSQPIVDVEREVHSAKDLPSGWDMRCLPYSGDGHTRLEHLIEARPTPTHSSEAGAIQATEGAGK